MSTFGMLLRTYRERAGLSQNDLSAQAGLSASTISRVESGDRAPPRRRRQVLVLAKALALSQEETDILLSAADMAPSTAPELSLHPRDGTLYQIAQELEALRSDPQVSPAQIRFVEESLLLLLRGARAALPMAELAVVPSGAPTARSLSEEERYLDDLLGDLRPPDGRTGGGPPEVTIPFAVLAAVARSPRWELKRRLAEALPALLAYDADWAVPLMETLRDDPPDPEWRTDIRRRAIESTPDLWRVRPGAAAPLLHWRDGDEVYAALATLEALADIGDADLSAQVREDLLSHVPDRSQPVVRLYADLLDRSRSAPDAVLKVIDTHRADASRLVRICVARSLHRLLPSRPAETLTRLHTLLRRENGRPAEHQNVRRAVARHPGGVIALLGGTYDKAALGLLRALAADPDVHIRRAICDALSEMAARAPEVALDLIEDHLLQDRDRFVHERTWTALRQLMAAGVERAEELCARLIEIA